MAGGNDFVSQLAKKSPQYKLGVMAAILAVFGFLYYQFMYLDMEEQQSRLQRKKRNLATEQAKLNTDLADKKRLAEKNEELQRTIRDNQKALPTEAELPSFFDHLQRKAGDAGVNIRRWDRNPEEDVDIYIRVPVGMEITGTFYNIMRYFSLLGPDAASNSAPANGDAGSRVDERIVSIENLSLGETTLKDGEVVLTAKFVASTFRQQESAQPPPKPAAKPKPGGPAGKAAEKVEKAAKDRAKKVDDKAAAGGK